MKFVCVFGHKWPEVWTKYGERSLITVDGIWFEVFEKKCGRNCGARKKLYGPYRYSKELGGSIR